MRSRRAGAVAAAAAALAAGLVSLHGQTSQVRLVRPGGLPLELQFAALTPGGAFLARLDKDADVLRVRLRWMDQNRVLAPASAGGSPSAWFGIDVEAAPGTHVLRIAADKPDGTTAEIRQDLVVPVREWPRTHLEVPPKTLVPPASELERIRREAELVSDILAEVSPAWLGSGPFRTPLPGYEPFPNFGQRRTYNTAKTISIHAGVDIGGAPQGTPIEAANAGIVVLANNLYFSGLTVFIDHGQGVFSQYLHMSELAVRRGDAVRAGQMIGKVGSTGLSTGPHLHWGLRILGKRVDPFALVGLPVD